MIKSRVFVTGINGFVGQNLKSSLGEDYDFKGISRKKNLDGLTYKKFLRDNNSYDAIIHLAGKAHDLKKIADDKEYYEVNYELTKLLFDKFLQSEAQKFIYISSVKAVADTVDGVLTEDTVSNPITAYGKSKRMSEEYILANLPKDKKVYILRPCMIHGPKNKGNLNLLFAMVGKGFPWPLGAFDNQRSFCSIANLCFVINELLVQENISSGVYNIADDESLSTNELIELIGESQNKKVRILRISKKWISKIARVGTFFNLPLNTERLQKLTESYEVNNTKILKAIDKTLPVDTKEGLLVTLKSFLK